MAPLILTVPANNSSFACFETGIDSPLIAASSMDVAPLMTIPSAGIRSPGFTTN